VASKIFNDPVYGFVSLPYEIVFDLVEHPWFQRLRRITQLGLSSLVYPGAIHTRFQHALGAVHLMAKALQVLRAKGHEISEEEAEASCIAILLHDLGHGPFSHALENTLVPFHHERLSLAMMEKLNEEFGGRLKLAREIFEGTYPRYFLHQLVSSQLDVDRLDYLTRDTYFTGVHEGVIGWNRIIDMMNVADGRLVVEAKGIHSIEKFIIARRIMYWQVYLHKTVLCAEQMLIRLLSRAQDLVREGEELFASPALDWILRFSVQEDGRDSQISDEFLENYSQIDDADLYGAFKVWMQHPDPVLSRLSEGIIHRKLFRISMSDHVIGPEKIWDLVERTRIKLDLDPEMSKQMILQGRISNAAYEKDVEGILIQSKGGQLKDLSLASDQLSFVSLVNPVEKYFACFPKEIGYL
jgi:HD superfamily phosphohydrolase